MHTQETKLYNQYLFWLVISMLRTFAIKGSASGSEEEEEEEDDEEEEEEEESSSPSEENEEGESGSDSERSEQSAGQYPSSLGPECSQLHSPKSFAGKQRSGQFYRLFH